MLQDQMLNAPPTCTLAITVSTHVYIELSCLYYMNVDGAHPSNNNMDTEMFCVSVNSIIIANLWVGLGVRLKNLGFFSQHKKNLLPRASSLHRPQKVTP